MRSRVRRLQARIAFATLLCSSLAFSDVDKEVLREQFREGLTAYEAGDVERALAIWKPIYERLGRAEGYRLAFNIAKAEAARSNQREAATWYAAYLGAVDARRQSGEPIEAGILGQEVEARDRLASLSRELVRFESTTPGASLTLDTETPLSTPAVLYAVPGVHRIELSRAGKPLVVRSEEFQKGSIVILREPEVTAPPRTSPTPQAATAPVLETVRPYSAAYPLVALGLASGFAVTTVVSYVRANDFYDNYAVAQPDARGDIGRSYDRARTTGYVSLAITLVLSAAATGLGAYWFLGSKDRPEKAAQRLPFGVIAF